LSLAEDKTGDGTRMKGVIGWAPIAAANFQEVLADLKQHKNLKGLRHLIQDEPDNRFI